MSKARLVITAIEVEGRSPAEVVAAYDVSRSWVYELLARYRTEGDAAFEPRSRRPHSSPGATPADRRAGAADPQTARRRRPGPDCSTPPAAHRQWPDPDLPPRPARGGQAVGLMPDSRG